MLKTYLNLNFHKSLAALTNECNVIISEIYPLQHKHDFVQNNALEKKELITIVLHKICWNFRRKHETAVPQTNGLRLSLIRSPLCSPNAFETDSAPQQ